VICFITSLIISHVCFVQDTQCISITVSHHLYEQLLQCSDLQGRSVSNLAAFLLESALDAGLIQSLSQASLRGCQHGLRSAESPPLRA
jgi:hypothetical protein